MTFSYSRFQRFRRSCTTNEILVPFNIASSSSVKYGGVVNVSGNESRYGLQNPSFPRSRDKKQHICACTEVVSSTGNVAVATAGVIHNFRGIWKIGSPAGISFVVRQCPPVTLEERLKVSGIIEPLERHQCSKFSYLIEALDAALDEGGIQASEGDFGDLHPCQTLLIQIACEYQHARQSTAPIFCEMNFYYMG